MFILAITVLGVSLVGLVTLFSLKYAEMNRDTLFASEFRVRADTIARMTKAMVHLGLVRIRELPHEALHLSRFLIHIGAVIFARGARAAEDGAHKLADRVSHKHRFERGETKSLFLKSVSEHKSKNGLSGRWKD